MFQKTVVEKIDFMHDNFFFENGVVYEKCGKILYSRKDGDSRICCKTLCPRRKQTSILYLFI
jgi:hypothetical protein